MYKKQEKMFAIIISGGSNVRGHKEQRHDFIDFLHVPLWCLSHNNVDIAFVVKNQILNLNKEGFKTHIT